MIVAALKQEEAAREEKQAFDKIASILETLTSKKVSMVSILTIVSWVKMVYLVICDWQ